ncbi:ROK family protein [Novosphingobium profundi]|uniref:ROK family protein n=1 Tax=Novosphingobium profundi TaxID=1774954 RepID=UPI001BDB5FFB|nr:ROK family protein [Novosphingobium profundi]MBT0670778.1 ROK family protein [Novosphingobium profundi]
MNVRIGIDFGGTKVEAAALDLAGNVLTRIRTATPGSYEGALAVLAGQVEELESRLGKAGGVGIGTPGSALAETGLMRNANTLYLNGRPLQRDLEQRMGRAVRLANDANCFALSEAVDGAAAGAGSVFGLIVGTGCGGGLVVGGTMFGGAHGLAGELGHMPLPGPEADELPPPACWCGQKGCIESWISGTGFQRAYRELTGEARGAEAIVAAAKAGDATAGQALDRYRDRLARALAIVANLLDPEVIVLGGGMSNVEALYEGLAEAVRARSFSGGWSGRVAKARWGDSSGVRGAALLWSREEVLASR